jgi:hypothetical protein
VIAKRFAVSMSRAWLDLSPPQSNSTISAPRLTK